MSYLPKSCSYFVQAAIPAFLRESMEKQKKLLRIVRQGLPEPIRRHCCHCVSEGDTLVVFLDSQAFLSQMRFFVPSLLRWLTENGLAFKEIQSRILFSTAFQPKKVPKIERELPPDSIVREFLAYADRSPDELGQALRHFATTIERLRSEATENTHASLSSE